MTKMTGRSGASERPVGLTVSVVVITTLLLLAGDARAALAGERTGEAGGGDVTVREGGRSVRAGDGCAEVEGGGRIVRTGDCDARSERPDDAGIRGRSARPGEITAPETTAPEGTLRERTVPETTEIETTGGAVPETTSAEGNDALPGNTPGPDEAQYDEETEPETTRPESPQPGTPVPERTLPEETVPEGPTEGRETTATPLAPGPPKASPLGEGRTPPVPSAAAPPSDQYAQPERSADPEHDAGPGAAEDYAAVPPAALPERQTPSGPVPVLPETGGPVAPPLFGAFLLMAGLLLAPVFRNGRRRR